MIFRVNKKVLVALVAATLGAGVFSAKPFAGQLAKIDDVVLHAKTILDTSPLSPCIQEIRTLAQSLLTQSFVNTKHYDTNFSTPKTKFMQFALSTSYRLKYLLNAKGQTTFFHANIKEMIGALNDIAQQYLGPSNSFAYVDYAKYIKPTLNEILKAMP